MMVAKGVMAKVCLRMEDYYAYTHLKFALKV